MSIQFFGCVRVYAFCSSSPRLLPSLLFVYLFCALVFEFSHSTCGIRAFFERSAINFILHVAFEPSFNARPQDCTHCPSAPSAHAPHGRWRHSNCLSECRIVPRLRPDSPIRTATDQFFPGAHRWPQAYPSTRRLKVAPSPESIGRCRLLAPCSPLAPRRPCHPKPSSPHRESKDATLESKDAFAMVMVDSWIHGACEDGNSLCRATWSLTLTTEG